MPKRSIRQSNRLSNADYINIMERVANDNYKAWGFSNADAALLHALNDNSYNYRGYYTKYPNSRANASTHWTDEFKTVHHPTFSEESIYSGKRSQYNPNGITGGHWEGNVFVPSIYQVLDKSNRRSLENGARREYKNGGVYIAPSKRGTLTAEATKHGMSPMAFAHKVMANKDNYSSKMVRKANFAINFNS